MVNTAPLPDTAEQVEDALIPLVRSDDTEETGPFGAPLGDGIDAMDATPMAEEWSPA